jgi:NAD(P)-dependent dehydrogenase (short-subunit alcohol dehydrogenase family)
MTHPVLQDKVAIVTGAAMGVGEATAILFAEAGAKVVVADYNEEHGRQTAQNIQNAGGQASFVAVDVSKAEQVRAMVEQTVATYGRLDVAVNNAAITPDTALVSEFDEDYWDRLMSINLTGVALCLKYELQQMVTQEGSGSIINISSTGGFRPQGKDIAYVSAKHAVIGMTKVAALENGPHDIRVNAVAPGAVDTPMTRAVIKETGRTMEQAAPVMSVLNRFAQPREIAQANLWLASDASSYVTGATLAVDGGYTNH